MDSIQYLGKKSAKLLFIALLLSAFSGCNIPESRDDCPPDKSLIYIRILDILTGIDITETTQDIETLTLYLFDKDRKFLRSYDITPEEIHHHLPIEVTDLDLAGGYATVWANVSELDEISEANKGDLLDNLTVTLTRNRQQTEFYMCPGDLFFGYTQLNFSECNTCCETIRKATVDVMRKNARIYITVRGLRNVQNPQDYYFKISSEESGYDFAGIPITNTARNIREAGTLNSINDFVSPQPYFMIHSPVIQNRVEDYDISVHLMNALTESEIISAEKDIEGNNIRLEQGKTTNVLMEILGTGDLQVQVVITDWDEIFQWSNW